MVREIINTPIPSPYDGQIRYRCDCCGDTTIATADDDLPHPWRFVRVSGWVGDLVACCDACATRVRRAAIRLRLADALRKVGL